MIGSRFIKSLCLLAVICSIGCGQNDVGRFQMVKDIQGDNTYIFILFDTKTGEVCISSMRPEDKDASRCLQTEFGKKK